MYSQHFTKTIMREFKARHGVDGIPSSTSVASSPATPRKPRAPRSSPVSAAKGKPKSTSASMRRALLKKEGSGGSATKRSRLDGLDDDDDDDDDDDEVKAEMETPSKKVKTEAAAMVKSEKTAPRRRGANVNASFAEDDLSFDKWVNENI